MDGSLGRGIQLARQNALSYRKFRLSRSHVWRSNSGKGLSEVADRLSHKVLSFLTAARGIDTHRLQKKR